MKNGAGASSRRGGETVKQFDYYRYGGQAVEAVKISGFRRVPEY